MKTHRHSASTITLICFHNQSKVSIVDGKEGLYLDIFLRGDPDDHGEPDDPGGTKIYFESLIWIWSYSGK